MTMTPDTPQTQQDTYSEIPHTVEEITVTVDRFSVVGDLILPVGSGDHPVLILVWGSGPMTRGVLPRPSAQVTRLLDAGFGVFIQDKPGFGASTGELSPDRVVEERTQVLLAELNAIRSHASVDASFVGVYGVSQAGYVLGMAIAAGAPIDFMITAACATNDGVSQSGYLIEKQLLCAGYPAEEAARIRRTYGQRVHAETYAEYLEAARVLDANPIVRDELGWGGIASEEGFAQYVAVRRPLFDPGPVIETLDMPVLALFAERDTQVDSAHGMAIYERAREQSGHALFRVQLIPGADHLMRYTETGSLREQRERYSTPGSSEYVAEYLDAVSGWLADLSAWRAAPGG